MFGFVFISSDFVRFSFVCLGKQNRRPHDQPTSERKEAFRFQNRTPPENILSRDHLPIEVVFSRDLLYRSLDELLKGLRRLRICPNIARPGLIRPNMEWAIFDIFRPLLPVLWGPRGVVHLTECCLNSVIKDTAIWRRWSRWRGAMILLLLLLLLLMMMGR